MLINNFMNRIYRSPENEGGAGSAAAAAPAASPASAATDSSAPAKDVIDVLRFDPFSGSDSIPDPKPASAGTDNAKPKPGNENTPAPKPGESPAASTQPAASATPSDNPWKEIAEKYQRELEAAKAPPKADSDDGDKIPEYNFDVPDALIQALTTDDPATFKKGVVALSKGIAAAIHAQMVNHLGQLYDPRFQGIPNMIAAAMQAQAKAKEVSDDFYGTYPELNQPALKNLVKSTSEGIAKAKGYKDWSPQLRDETAAAVKAILAAATGGQPAAQPTPPRMLSTQGARPAAPANDESKEMTDLLNYF